MEAIDLIGTWQFFRGDEPLGPAYLHFTYTRAYDYLADGDARQMLSLYYTLEAPDRIRFRNHPDEEGWTCQVELDAEKLVITAEDSTKTVCTRASAEDIPKWFLEVLSK
jgi:hypothetical protein